jgi:hypothetical protein
MYYKIINVKGKESLVVPAFIKGQWRYLMMLHVPNEAFEDQSLHQIKINTIDSEVAELRRNEYRDCEVIFDQIDSLITEIINPKTLSAKEIREICDLNDIPESWVRIENQSKRRGISKSNRIKRRLGHHPDNQPLIKQEYRSFYKVLKRICSVSALIAEILWYFNSQLAPGDAYITLEELLRIKLYDVAAESSLPFTWLSVKCRTERGIHMVQFPLPYDLWERLNGHILKQMQKQHIFVFSTKSGGPLHSKHVLEKFKQAGKEVGIKQNVTSLCLGVTQLNKF